MNTKQIGPFFGINNRRQDFDLAVKTKEISGNYVRSASNVLLTSTGKFKRRKSADKIQSMSGAHSMFENYIIRSATLYRITLPAYTETLVKLLDSNAQGGWIRIGSDIYFSNGVDRLRIDSAGNVLPWGMPTPDSPDVSTIPGSLNTGWYQIALAYRNADTGEEGGVSPSSNYYVDGGGARVALPGAVDGATHIDVYISGCNGEVPTFYATYVASATSADITATATGKEAMQRYEDRLPAGDQLFYYNGRLCSIKDNVIYYGLPFRPGYYQPVDGYIPFPAAVSVAVPAQNGIYVAADKTYWFPGDISQLTDNIQDVLPYGAVKGTGFSIPNKTIYGWFGEKGIVIGDSQGEVQAVMSDNITLIHPANGVSFVVDDDDSRRVISCGWCVNLESKYATTYSDYAFTSVYGRYATKSDGIYDIQGTSDVSWSINLGRLNFGDNQKKHIPYFYADIESTATISIEISYVDVSGSVVSYSYTSRSYGSLGMQRIDIGKGARSNWFDITISGNKSFVLASISAADVSTKRKI